MSGWAAPTRLAQSCKSCPSRQCICPSAQHPEAPGPKHILPQKAKPSRTSIQSFPKMLDHMSETNMNIPPGVGCALQVPNRAVQTGGGQGPQRVYSTVSLGATTSPQQCLLKANEVIALTVLYVPLTAITGNGTSYHSICKNMPRAPS